MIWIEGKGTKGPIFEPVGIDPGEDFGEGEVFRVRNLLEKLVRESVRDFGLREKALPLLTLDSIKDGLAKGKIGRSRDEIHVPDLDQAIGQALQGFEDGLFLLFVDDEEKRSLEEMVSLAPGTRVTIFRLTALAGGF